jgi:hypothetical protein
MEAEKLINQRKETETYQPKGETYQTKSEKVKLIGQRTEAEKLISKKWKQRN